VDAVSAGKRVNSRLYADSLFPFIKKIFSKKKSKFDRRNTFYPANCQKYIHSSSWNSILVAGKNKRVAVPLLQKKNNFRFDRKIVIFRRRVFVTKLVERFKRLTYNFEVQFDFSRYKFFDNRFLFLKKSFYFFNLNRLLKRSRNSFVNFFYKFVNRFVTRKFYYNKRIRFLRRVLTKEFRDLFNNRFFLRKLKKFYINTYIINIYNLYLIGMKLYLKFRLRCFFICVGLFLANPLLKSYTRFNLWFEKFGGNSVSSGLKYVICKRKPILTFLRVNLKRDSLALSGGQGFKKSFFYFFKNPYKKIKKRFFLKFKKIKKRFFKYNVKDNNDVKNLSFKKEIESVTGLSLVDPRKGDNNLNKVSKSFLKKEEFLSKFNRNKGIKIVSSGFMFFGQRFTGKNNDLKMLTLIRSLYRIGLYRASQVLLNFRRNFNMRLLSLSTKFRVNLEVFLRTLIINETFKLFEEDNFNRKLAVRSYHSTRFRLKLPIRGQRTHSNAGTPKKLQSRFNVNF
jgi:small subunit ribosomal protein S13